MSDQILVNCLHPFIKKHSDNIPAELDLTASQNSRWFLARPSSVGVQQNTSSICDYSASNSAVLCQYWFLGIFFESRRHFPRNYSCQLSCVTYITLRQAIYQQTPDSFQYTTASNGRPAYSSSTSIRIVQIVHKELTEVCNFQIPVAITIKRYPYLTAQAREDLNSFH